MKFSLVFFLFNENEENECIMLVEEMHNDVYHVESVVWNKINKNEGYFSINSGIWKNFRIKLIENYYSRF
jgi:uncharacterized protein YabN with tetrapyrrole methylase and pyrophosphatase domain